MNIIQTSTGSRRLPTRIPVPRLNDAVPGEGRSTNLQIAVLRPLGLGRPTLATNILFAPPQMAAENGGNR